MTLSKIEFIQQQFPEIEHIDPTFDERFVYKVARALFEHKFYKQWHGGIETSVCNLILRAKGTFKKRKVYKITKVKDLKKP